MNRWLRYGLLGFGFGVLDYGLMELAARAARSIRYDTPVALQVVSALLLYGAIWLVWLLPLVPVVLAEFKTTAQYKHAILAGVTVWVLAMVGYYLTYAFYLLVIGAPNLDHLLLRNRRLPDYWWVTSHFIRGVVINQFIEWSLAAVVLGGAAGFLCAWLYRRRNRRVFTAHTPPNGPLSI
ncbi:MAG: hypothetical protein ACYC6L_06110 [Anaerolineae bacterium]